MATTTFTDFNISDTYLGILHVKGEILPEIGQQYIYDGGGNKSDMRLGRDGAGVSFNGSLSAQTGKFITLSCSSFDSTYIRTTGLSVNGLKYPIIPGPLSGIMVQGANNQLVICSKIPTGSIPALVPNPQGSYNQIDRIVVNSAGQVTSITEIPATSIYTVTSTTYFQYASNPTHVITPSKNHSAIDWGNIPLTAKTAILYIGPRNDQLNELQTYTLFGSPDGSESHEWPLQSAGGSQSRTSNPSPYMDGTQCIVRLESDGNGNMRTFFRRSNDSPSQTIEVYLIGYQQ